MYGNSAVHSFHHPPRVENLVQALAFTSKRPGKTQQFNYFVMNNNTDNAFYLVDMPGMGYAKARAPPRPRFSRSPMGSIVQV